MLRLTPQRAASRLLVLAALACPMLHAQSLEVAVDADASFTRTFDWTLEKSVTPEFSDRFIGESQQLDYTITVDRGDGVDSDFAITGEATIANPGTEPATITSITIMLGASVVTHACATGELAGGTQTTCPFSVNVTSSATQTLTATVETSGAVAGGSDSVDVVFGEPEVENGSITVTDTNLAEPLAFSDSGSHQYSLDAQCINGNSVVVDNTATIVETGEDDTVQARVGCHTLRMERNAFASTGASWTWTIDKSHAEELPLNLTVGQTYDVDYTITATATADETGSGDVTGNVTILNTHPLSDAELVSVEVLINGSVAGVVNCPSLIVPDAEYDSDSNVIFGQLVCPFTATMPAGETASTITGIVTQQLYAYSADGTPTAMGTKVYTGTSGVTAGGTGAETDECIAISDLYLGTTHDLGMFCAGDSPVVLTFTGSIEVTADSECEFEVPNLARFVTNDTGTEGEDDTVVTVVRTDCDEGVGCTRTPGYWKTHSIYGPAPYDDTWAAIGEDTAFFLATDGDGNALSWYDVLWTSPRGNAYFILAPQYVAASLNILAGASASAQVLDAMDEATALLEAWTPAQIGALRGNQAPRPMFIELAGVLDMYNNGIGDIGPEHCSEDDTSAE